METKQVLIIGHSIIRRFHQFLKDDEDVRFCKDMGFAKTHRIYLSGVGDRKISNIIKDYAAWIYRIKPDQNILLLFLEETLFEVQLY